jgi:hypothetical protein
MTTPTFDPYRDWLGIQDTQRPLDHYQLLRLKRFEDDLGKIRENYQKLSTHVRKQLAGKAAPFAHKLLGELTKSMLCLTDASRKEEYDSSLGRTGSGERKLYKFDDLLIARKILTSEQLVKAQKFSHVTGIELHDAIVQQKLATAEVVTQIRAESMGVPYVDLTDADFTAETIAKLPAVLARQHSLMPLAVENGQIIVAAAGPFSTAVEDELRLRLGMPARLVLASPAKLHEAVNKFYTKEAAASEMGITRPTVDTAKVDTGPPIDPVERAKKRQQMTMVAGMMTFAVIAMLGNNVFEWSLLTTWGGGALLGGIAAAIAWKMN